MRIIVVLSDTHSEQQIPISIDRQEALISEGTVTTVACLPLRVVHQLPPSSGSADISLEATMFMYV